MLSKLRTQGRIINVSMSIKDEVNRDGAKAAAGKVLENLSKDQKDSKASYLPSIAIKNLLGLHLKNVYASVTDPHSLIKLPCKSY